MWELDFTHFHQLHWVIKELIYFVLLVRTILLTWREGVSVETDIWHLTVWTIAGSGRVKLRMWQSSDINVLDSTEPRFITINVAFVSSHWPDLNLIFSKEEMWMDFWRFLKCIYLLGENCNWWTGIYLEGNPCVLILVLHMTTPLSGTDVRKTLPPHLRKAGLVKEFCNRPMY